MPNMWKITLAPDKLTARKSNTSNRIFLVKMLASFNIYAKVV
jgi:hypothetical protein